MDTAWMQVGIFAAVGSTLIAALLGAFGKHRLSLSLLSAGTFLGALASGSFLMSNASHVLLPNVTLFWGAHFQIDILSALFFCIVNLVCSIVALFAIGYAEHYASTYRLSVLDPLTAFFIFGMQGVVLSTTPMSFLVFWEIMSLSSFFLVFSDRKKESIHAGLFYLIMTHLGAGALLASFAILSGGSLVATFSTMATAAPHLSYGMEAAAFFLVLFGFGSKAGLWPFHAWLPEAHPQAPSHISALMSGVMLKLALYGFLRITLFVMPAVPLAWSFVIIGLGLLSAVYGVLYAVVERDLKRLLAYSSMENLGLIFTMVGAAGLARTLNEPRLFLAALAAALFHAIAHAFFKSGLFMGAGIIIHEIHDRSIEKMGGLANRMSTFSGTMLILILTAAALPPFSGFVGEWIFLQELLATISHATPLVQGILVLILATFSFVGGLAVFAMIKLFGLVFLAEPRSEHAAQAKQPSFQLLSPIIAVTAIGILVSLFAPTILHFIRMASLTVQQKGSSSILSGTDTLSISLLSLLLFLGVLLAYGFRRLFSERKKERLYHTWDCGQPITAQMEYTATAFSAPIRFFFRMMLRTKKEVITTPIIPSNPWITSRTFSLEIRRIWVEIFYLPLAHAIIFSSTQIRRLQNGVIQFYIALILLALVVTITLAI